MCGSTEQTILLYTRQVFKSVWTWTVVVWFGLVQKGKLVPMNSWELFLNNIVIQQTKLYFIAKNPTTNMCKKKMGEIDNKAYNFLFTS